MPVDGFAVMAEASHPIGRVYVCALTVPVPAIKNTGARDHLDLP